MKTNIVDPRQRFPSLPMTEEEANKFMWLEAETGQPVCEAVMAQITLLMLRVKDDKVLEAMRHIIRKEIKN